MKLVVSLLACLSRNVRHSLQITTLGSIVRLIAVVGICTFSCSSERAMEIPGPARTGTTVTGYLEISPMVRGPDMHRNVYVHSKNGDRHLLGPEFEQSFLPFANRWVRVTGQLVSFSGSNMGGVDYLETESIELLSGSLNKASTVPAPPIIDSIKQISNLHGHWAIAYGTPTFKLAQSTGTQVPDTVVIESVTLKFRNGDAMTKYLHRLVTAETLQEYQAAGVATMLFSFQKDSMRTQAEKFCPKQNPHCGMPQTAAEDGH